jgi:prepilin-type N-terminal cleavage/methylation domain-containing protein
MKMITKFTKPDRSSRPVRFNTTSQKSKFQQGFTLLEVIIALAIVAMVLGTTFSLLAGSKRLAFKAADDIGEVIFLRSAINVAQIDYPELPKRYADGAELKTEELLEKPEEQTRPISIGLEPYIWKNKQRGLDIVTIRWKKLDTTR